MANIRKRGKTYQFTVSMGFDGSGRRKIKTKTWIPPSNLTDKQAEREAKFQADLFEKSCQGGMVVDGNITLEKFIIYYLENRGNSLREKTLSRYKQLIPRINQALGHIQLSKLQKHQILAFYSNLSEVGVREDTKFIATENLKIIAKKKKLSQAKIALQSGLSVNTVAVAFQGNNVRKETAEKIANIIGVKLNEVFTSTEPKTLSAQTCIHYHRFLSAMLNFAVDRDLLAQNPCERIKTLPWKIERQEARYLDEKQALMLIEAVENQGNYQYEIMVKLLVHTGLRRGELCGLEWEDFNFERGTLTISRSLLNTAEKGIFVDLTKNFSSRRTIAISAGVVELVQNYKVWQDKFRLTFDSKFGSTKRLFTAQDGSDIHPNTLTAWFNRFVKETDLPSVCVHSLRHTDATLQIAAGVPITTVSRRLGHSTVATTTRIYAHSIQSADEAAAEVLEDILNPNKKK